MAVRPYVTSGIAIASAGLLVAAMPTIAPPLTQRDVQVAAAVETQLTAAQTDLLKAAQSFNVESFVGALQAVAPQNAVGAATLIGAAAPISAQNLADLPEIIQGIVNDFFEGGIVQVVGNLALALVEGNQLAEDLVTAFFFGGVPDEETPAGFVGVINVLIDAVLGGLGTMTAAAPQNAVGAATLIGAAAPIGAQNLADLPEIIQGIVNDFFEGGIVQVVGNLALALVEGNQLAEDLVTAFFFGGVPDEETPAGFVGVINVLIDAVLGGLGTMTAAAPQNAVGAATLIGAAAPIGAQNLADLQRSSKGLSTTSLRAESSRSSETWPSLWSKEINSVRILLPRSSSAGSPMRRLLLGSSEWSMS